MRRSGTSTSVSLAAWLAVACVWAAAGAAGAQITRVPPPPEPEPVRYTRDAGDRADAGDAIESVRARHGVPALAAALVTLDGTQSIGVAGRRSVDADAPVGLDDRFHVGSLTKSMTATLAARLIEEGRLRWDTPLGRTNRILRDEVHPGWMNRTLAQFLTHRSGLPDDREPTQLFRQLRALGGLMRDQRLGVCEAIFANEPPEDTGEFAYSNFGYVAAASMMEGVTAQTWEELIELELFRPLGISSFGFGPPALGDTDPGAPTQPIGHRPTGTGFEAIGSGENTDNPAWMRPAGGVHMTIADLATYALAHLRGAAGAETLPAFLPMDLQAMLYEPPEDGTYALGWSVGPSPLGTGRVLAHDGSNGSFYAVIWLAPEAGVGAVATSNAGGESAMRACHDAIARLIGDHLAAGG